MQEPTAEQAEQIIDCAADLFGAYDLEVYEGYSGRGMYGARCTAITGRSGDDRSIFQAVGYLIATEELPAEAGEWFHRSDQMGLGWVRY